MFLPTPRHFHGGMSGVGGHLGGHGAFPVHFKLCHAGDLPGPALMP